MADVLPPFVVVFDLDDTLYLERDYVVSGFKAASAWFEQATGVVGLDTICLDLFNGGVRTEVFNRALEDLGLRIETRISQLVKVYREHTPTIKLTPDAAQYLHERNPSWRYAIITDGNSLTQMNKIEVLGLGAVMSKIVCTGSWGREFWKPSHRPFEAVETWAGTEPSRLVYVADNPTKDFITPRRRGWWTVQVQRPEGIHKVLAPSAAHEAHASLNTLELLDELLASLDRKWERPRLPLTAR